MNRSIVILKQKIEEEEGYFNDSTTMIDDKVKMKKVDEVKQNKVASTDESFDLNKFPIEAIDGFEEKEFVKVVKTMLSIYLPKFY